jgi:dTMP kinase
MVGGGMLIVFEGIDGSGKSTQARLLAAALQKIQQHGQLATEIVLTEEPTTGLLGQKLRTYLAGPVRNLTAEEELHLFVMDRKEHVAQIIKPALAAGKIVICDRYYYSSVAYQGALGLDVGAILAENEAFAPEPDLVFLLSLSIPEALKHLSKKGTKARQVSESPPYLEQVAAIYASLDGPAFRHLDGSLPPEVLHETVLEQTLDTYRNLP